MAVTAPASVGHATRMVMASGSGWAADAAGQGRACLGRPGQSKQRPKGHQSDRTGEPKCSGTPAIEAESEQPWCGSLRNSRGDHQQPLTMTVGLRTEENERKSALGDRQD